MTATKNKILAVFKAAEKLNASLWMACIDPAYMSVEELADHVREHYGVTIDFKVVDLETVHVYGHIERYGEGGKDVIIYIVKNIPIRWKRLVGTKELCHIILDLPEDQSTEGEDTLARLVTPLLEPYAPENAAIWSESLAEALAWEILYPYECRKDDLNRIANGETTIADIAAHYRIPVHITDVVLSAPYMEWCDRYWREIVEHHEAKLHAKVAAREQRRAELAALAAAAAEAKAAK